MSQGYFAVLIDPIVADAKLAITGHLNEVGTCFEGAVVPLFWRVSIQCPVRPLGVVHVPKFVQDRLQLFDRFRWRAGIDP
ncbi:hypothetical protein AUR04nite_17270 [Glutamicibacter uratoxydans]|uniref:Uncharacterized protein n=1 Tax=Glutamicibacter uratoxydans TaxID=43667 RepID=A0A4Y4DRG3_GLUUR|nr:hypothetical protein AUR04nite_17270 [Glutamicibacter uratoxydans]